MSVCLCQECHNYATVYRLTSLVLRGEGLEVPGILQGLHLVADSPTEQADEVQAVQLKF